MQELLHHKGGGAFDFAPSAAPVRGPRRAPDFLLPVGKETIRISDEERRLALSAEAAHLKLLGFRPRASLRLEQAVGHCAFVAPDEIRSPGSGRAVAALQEAMDRRRVVALVKWVPRRAAHPRFALLVPQRETFDPRWPQHPRDGCGFHVFRLPFAEDLRELHLPWTLPAARAAEAQGGRAQEARRSAKKLLNGMFLDAGYALDSITNPALQFHFAALEAIANNEAKPREVVDCFQPDKLSLEKLQEETHEFKQLVFGAPCQKVQPPAPKTLGGAAPATARKRPAQARDCDLEVVEPLAARGALSSLTVTHLKAWLAHNGLEVCGVKAELVARITQSLQARVATRQGVDSQPATTCPTDPQGAVNLDAFNDIDSWCDS
eukprot:GHVT01045195.1.p1 GENE.GHVT01045195.1~~GHVT01045195.1.p1  ORF type:complete len:378 (-),score=108.28 GHVT01045195.1:1002-2135(-)